MRFFSFITHNVARRPFRSGLTVSAIAVAVCAMVALVSVSAGFERSFLKLYQDSGVDLVVLRAGVRSPLTSTIEASLADKISQIDGVKHVIPELRDSISFEEQGIYAVAVFGWVPQTVPFEHLQVVSGRSLRPGDSKRAMLGTILADNLGKKVGDLVRIFGEAEFEVVGVYESNSLFEAGAIVMSLDSLQRLLAREGDVTSYSVVVENGKDNAEVERVRVSIERIRSGIMVIPTREHVDSMTEMRVARAMAWLTSVVGLLIGGVSTFNTMSMSVYERIREIGILRAIGWGRGRILRMVLSESLVLSVAGGVGGVVAAAVLLQVLTLFPAAGGLIVRWVQPWVVAEGMVLASVVGLIGGLVPAYSAARMEPTVAIHTK